MNFGLCWALLLKMSGFYTTRNSGQLILGRPTFPAVRSTFWAQGDQNSIWRIPDIFKYGTEPNVLLKENDTLEAQNYDVDVPCPIQWGLLWFSAPSNLNRKFVNNGTKVSKFRETVRKTIELTLKMTFDGAHTPKACLLRSVSMLLSYAPDRDWDLEEEMTGWCVWGKSTITTSRCRWKRNG